MGIPTGYLVEIQGVGSVPLCMTEGKSPRLYAAFQTTDGPGKIEYPKYVDNPEDLRDLGFATLKKRGASQVAKPEKSPTRISEKTPEAKPEKSPTGISDKPAVETPKKKRKISDLI